MALLVGWMLMLMGVIFFFAGGGWAILRAFMVGEYARVLHEPRFIFSGLGFGIWLLGTVMMLAGWIAARRREGR